MHTQINKLALMFQNTLIITQANPWDSLRLTLSHGEASAEEVWPHFHSWHQTLKSICSGSQRSRAERDQLQRERVYIWVCSWFIQGCIVSCLSQPQPHLCLWGSTHTHKAVKLSVCEDLHTNGTNIQREAKCWQAQTRTSILDQNQTQCRLWHQMRQQNEEPSLSNQILTFSFPK